MLAPFRHLLLLVDDADAHVEAVSHAVALARAMGASLALADVSGETERRAERVARAAAAAHALGVPFEPWAPSAGVDDAVERARSRHCDLVVTASPAWAAAAAGHSLPVLLAAADEAPTPASRAIAALRAGHRRQADAVHLVLALLAAARTRHGPVDAGAMRAAFAALQATCPARWHEAEEQQLFARLRRRNHDWDAELDELARQHRRDAEHRDALALAIDTLEAAGAGERLSATQALDERFNAYARFVWEHFGREEGVVLPAARSLLSDADWEAVAASIEKSGVALEQRGAARHDADTVPFHV